MTHTGHRTKTIAFGAAASLVLYASGLLVLFTPLPILYVSAVRGRRDGRTAALAACSVVVFIYTLAMHAAGGAASSAGAVSVIPAMGLAPFFEPAFLWIAGVGGFAFFVVTGLALGEGAHAKFGLTRWVGTALTLSLLVLGVVIAAGSAMKLEGGGFSGYLSRIMAEVVAINRQAGSGGAELGILAENSERIVAFTVGIAPSIFFIFALMTVVVNMLVGRRMIRGSRIFSHVRNVARFRLPDQAVWAVIGAGILFFVSRYVLQVGGLKLAAMNALIALGALYFLQGLSVVVYFLQGLRAPLLRTMAYAAIIFFFQSVGMIIVAIGVADVWVDFRLRSWRARHSREA